jgi:hypothetical protein
VVQGAIGWQPDPRREYRERVDAAFSYARFTLPENATDRADDLEG